MGIIPYQIFMGGVLTGRYAPDSQPPEDSHMASRHAQRAKDTYWNERTFGMVETLKTTAAESGNQRAAASYCVDAIEAADNVGHRGGVEAGAGGGECGGGGCGAAG